jgi:hypothetical protein
MGCVDQRTNLERDPVDEDLVALAFRALHERAPRWPGGQHVFCLSDGRGDEYVDPDERVIALAHDAIPNAHPGSACAIDGQSTAVVGPRDLPATRLVIEQLSVDGEEARLVGRWYEVGQRQERHECELRRTERWTVDRCELINIS